MAKKTNNDENGKVYRVRTSPEGDISWEVVYEADPNTKDSDRKQADSILFGSGKKNDQEISHNENEKVYQIRQNPDGSYSKEVIYEADRNTNDPEKIKVDDILFGSQSKNQQNKSALTLKDIDADTPAKAEDRKDTKNLELDTLNARLDAAKQDFARVQSYQDVTLTLPIGKATPSDYLKAIQAHPDLKEALVMRFAITQQILNGGAQSAESVKTILTAVDANMRKTMYQENGYANFIDEPKVKSTVEQWDTFVQQHQQQQQNQGQDQGMQH